MALPTLLFCLSSHDTVRRVERSFLGHLCPDNTHTAVLLRWRFWRNAFLVFLTEARWNFPAKLFQTFPPSFLLYFLFQIQQAPIFPPLEKKPIEYNIMKQTLTQLVYIGLWNVIVLLRAHAVFKEFISTVRWFHLSKIQFLPLSISVLSCTFRSSVEYLQFLDLLFGLRHFHWTVLV